MSGKGTLLEQSSVSVQVTTHGTLSDNLNELHVLDDGSNDTAPDRSQRPERATTTTTIPLNGGSTLQLGSVADLPEAQAVGRRRGGGGRAVAPAEDRHHVAGPALADADLHHRADQRRAPSASRTTLARTS